MAQKTIVHKGYHGTLEVNTRDYSLSGRILFLEEELTYSGKSFEELEANFREAVEVHIQKCKALGQEPPFSE